MLLHKTFPLWPQNAETVMTNEEDIKFLKSMQTDRVATFGGLDQKQITKLKKCQHKKKIITTQREKALQKQLENDEKVELLSSTDESFHGSDLSTSETEDFFDHNVQPECFSTRKHVKTKTGTASFFHSDLLKSKRLTSLAARLNMTPAQQHIYTKALIEETGGDSSKVKISYSYADKSRREVVENIAFAAKDSWAPPTHVGLSLHWDSKQLPSLNNPNVLEERLVVVVGTQQDTKLLGTPSYPSRSCGDRSAGRKVADLTVQLVEEWNCSENIINMVFDNTASNTGHLIAACVCIQKQLDRALLWSGCRHHVGEVVLSHIFEDLNIETSKSPDISMFLKFRKHFDALDTTTPLIDISTLEVDEPAAQAIKQWKSYSMTVLRGDFIPARDDYNELIQLCTIFLGEKVSFSWRRPGALHKARWMAKMLYAFKICLLESAVNELPPGSIATKQQISKLRRFCTFSALIYCPWWFSCSSAVDAPSNDLKLYKSILKYSEIDEVVSNSAKKAFQCHLWFLTPEMIPFSLFSDLVAYSVKDEMAKKLLSLQPNSPVITPSGRHGTGFGKPNFPRTLNATTTLTDLITEDSWFLFHASQIDSGFLHKGSHTWQDIGSYQQGQEKVNAINVINDCAERGVKLTTDFLSSARSEN